MTFQSWLLYLVFVLVACSTPGPAVLFITTNVTLHGWKTALTSALGNIVGLLLMGIVAVTGLGTLLNTSEIFFNLIKYFGAAYLVYLGARLFFQKEIDLNELQGRFSPAEKSPRRIFFQAMGVALSNPKAIVFLTALFPQFLDVSQPLMLQFAVLITTLMFFSLVFLLGYALLAYKAKLWLFKPQRMKIFNRVSGSIFVGFGALLATSHK